MTKTVTAIYENGILRPLEPLLLRNRQTVQIQIIPTQTISEAEQAVQILVANGLLTPPPGESKFMPLAEARRRQSADSLGKAAAKPASEMILEDRIR